MISLYSIPPLCGSILVLLIGVFIFQKNRRSMVNITFLLFCLSVFVWLFSYTIAYSTESFEVATFFTTLACTAVIFTAPTTYHFFVEYLGFHKLRKTIIIPYTIMGILTPLFLMTNYFLKKPHKTFWGYYSTAGPLHPVYLLIHFTILSVPYLLLYRKYFKEPDITSTEKIRLKYNFLWYTIAAFSGIDFAQKYGVEFYPFGSIFIIIFVIVTAYAILRYRLMDIYIVITRTAAYSISTGLLTGFFIVLVLFSTKYLSPRIGISEWRLTIIPALIIAMLFAPLKGKVQKIIDKIFYKKTYDYYETLDKITHEFTSTFDFRKICSFIGDIIFSTLGLKHIYILYLLPSGSYRVVYSISHEKDKEIKDTRILKIDGNSETIKLLSTSRDVVIREELPHIHTVKDETVDRVNEELKPFKGEAIVPVFIDNKLELLMILGEKLSWDIFSDEDVRLLDTISHQTAIAVKNARLYQEKLMLERFASIGMMSATFAHEIRNPLTSLRTFTELMPEKYYDPDFREAFKKVVSFDIERINKLLTDLTEFSTNGKKTERSRFNITELIDEIADYIQKKFESQKNITIEKKYKDIELNIIGDRDKLKHAFINIMNNGCQAMERGGVLRVVIVPDGRNVNISISDTGRGIDIDDIDRIFEPFYTTKDRGMGLGLAISKKAVEENGGNIRVESELGYGTTFIITLPLTDN